MSEIEVSCWCYATRRQVYVKGRVVGERQADLLRISDCEHEDCAKRYAKDCLIGKLLEGR
jgi:hypothetical protein